METNHKRQQSRNDRWTINQAETITFDTVIKYMTLIISVTQSHTQTDENTYKYIYRNGTTTIGSDDEDTAIESNWMGYAGSVK